MKHTVAKSLGLIVLCASTAAAQDTATISGSFAPAQPIERGTPTFPLDARTAGKEGWVVVSFCTDGSGKVIDPAVVSSSPDTTFDEAALTAVRGWTYAPARFDDQPIQQCGWATNLRFDLDDVHAARTEFVQMWRTIVALIDAGRLKEATAQIDAITPWNNYEYARLALLRAHSARANRDPRTELEALGVALDWSGKLEPELVTNALRRSFVLQLQLGQLAAAQTTYVHLRDHYAQSWTESERKAGDHLVELINSSATLSTPGLIARRAGPNNGKPLWSVRLLRPSFAIDAPGGGIARIEVQCDERWYASPFSATQVWAIPSSWGTCRLYVFGDEGASLKLLEYAKE